MRLERFTEKAQEAFQESQEIMQELHHTQLDVEHIFLAMLRQPKGLAQRALEKLGVQPEEAIRLVEREAHDAAARFIGREMRRERNQDLHRDGAEANQ